MDDCISRKMAIDALDKHIDTFDAIDTNYLCGLRTAMSILKEMPSAQPETHDKRTETHECDLISRQAAIDAVVSAMIDGADAELVEGVMELLPSAQPNVYVSTKEADYISRAQALNAINVGGNLEGAWINVAKLPSARPERKKGKWIEHNPHKWGLGIIYECSECGYEMDCEEPNYCPSCGADMRGESE